MGQNNIILFQVIRMDFVTFNKGTYWRKDKIFEVDDFGGRDMGGNNLQTPIVPVGISIRFEGETGGTCKTVKGPANLEAVLRSLLRDKTDWDVDDEKIVKRRSQILSMDCSRCPRSPFIFKPPTPPEDGLQIVQVRTSHDGYCCKF